MSHCNLTEQALESLERALANGTAWARIFPATPLHTTRITNRLPRAAFILDRETLPFEISEEDRRQLAMYGFKFFGPYLEYPYLVRVPFPRGWNKRQGTLNHEVYLIHPSKGRFAKILYDMQANPIVCSFEITD